MFCTKLAMLQMPNRGRWRSQVFLGGRGGRGEEGNFSNGTNKMIHPSLESVSRVLLTASLSHNKGTIFGITE